MWPVDPAFGKGVAARRAPVRHVLMSADAVGGVWRYAVDLGGALAARDVRVTLAVMGPPPDAAGRRDAEQCGLVVVHRPYRLEWMDEPWDDVGRAGQWLLALERTLLPDVVHLNGYAHARLPWFAPVLVVAHSCVCTWWRAVKGEQAPGRLDTYRAAVAAGLDTAALVVAPTRAMLDALEAEYGAGARSRVVPNGAAGNEPPPAVSKDPVVLAAGRAWDEAKNISALCAVAHEVPWPVYVAGDDHEPGGRPCELPSVRRLGRLGPAAMREWYARASIYALPARYEPFGLSVLEAARAGCALVLGDIPSLRENWNGAAEFVAPEDHRGLAAALSHLIERPARRRELSRLSSARAAQFDIERTAEEYLRLYEDLAG
jgi:glycogen(starch) synthase